jgi:hypothetical protein
MSKRDTWFPALAHTSNDEPLEENEKDGSFGSAMLDFPLDDGLRRIELASLALRPTVLGFLMVSALHVNVGGGGYIPSVVSSDEVEILVSSVVSSRVCTGIGRFIDCLDIAGMEAICDSTSGLTGQSGMLEPNDRAVYDRNMGLTGDSVY